MLKVNKIKMIKLYKKINNQLHYWQTWENDNNSTTVHWGIVGEEGTNKIVRSNLFSNHKTKVKKEVV